MSNYYQTIGSILVMFFSNASSAGHQLLTVTELIIRRIITYEEYNFLCCFLAYIHLRISYSAFIVFLSSINGRQKDFKSE